MQTTSRAASSPVDEGRKRERESICLLRQPLLLSSFDSDPTLRRMCVASLDEISDAQTCADQMDEKAKNIFLLIK